MALVITITGTPTATERRAVRTLEGTRISVTTHDGWAVNGYVCPTVDVHAIILDNEPHDCHSGGEIIPWNDITRITTL